MLKIGVDFDNTIACYDQVFFLLAQQNGVPGIFRHQNKLELKKIIHDFAGDVLWQRIQGLAYGQEMYLATLFPGFLEFLLRSLIAGNQVYIVSHKTEYGHFDKNKISLRDASRSWIKNKVLDCLGGKFNFSFEHIFFEATREQKIDRINELDCDVFIDDLIEVLENPSLNVPIKKIYFTPLKKRFQDGTIPLNSWHKISDYLYGKIKPEEILVMANALFVPRKFDSIAMHKQGGNSRVFQLKSGDASYALKIYPNRDIDLKMRLETERTVCKVLRANHFNVPLLLDSSDELKWALFEWLDGQCPSPINSTYIKSAAKFICDLQNNSVRSELLNIGPGTEACLSVSDLFRQLDSRINILLEVSNENLSEFIRSSILPLVENFRIQAGKNLANQFFECINPDKQILSPGDFGAHNTFLMPSGELFYFDFEYFGWDDPVKLVSDFYWHPAMSLNNDQKGVWLNAIIVKLGMNQECLLRLSLLLPVFGIRWCLIMLRKFTELAELDLDSSEFEDLSTYCDNQLIKSKKMFNQILEMVLDGYPIKIS